MAPPKLESPKFIETPQLSKVENGILKVKYQLDSSFKDKTQISWFRCTDAKGSNPIETAISTNNVPLTEYPLTLADAGYYIMAKIAPKNSRSDAGIPFVLLSKKPISTAEIIADKNLLSTNFKNVSLKNQHKIIPGFWTFRPLNNEVTDTSKDAWYYGKGVDGANNQFGLLQTGRSAAILYTPIERKYTDMKTTLNVTPFKTAGQGFRVADLYMDVLIKFNNKTYALHFIRTTKYHEKF